MIQRFGESSRDSGRLRKERIELIRRARGTREQARGGWMAEAELVIDQGPEAQGAAENRWGDEAMEFIQRASF